MPKSHESAIVIGRAVLPSLKIGPILTVQRYPSSAILDKHDATPKLGSNGRWAATMRGRPLRTSLLAMRAVIRTYGR
jgi:hypothetical protein